MPDENEILKYLTENGMINPALVLEEMEMLKRKELLEKHPYKVWEDKHHVWHTYLPDEENQRLHRKRNSKKEIEDIIVKYWRDAETNPTVREIFTEWNDRRLELRKISPASHLRNQQTFNRHYDKMGDRKIGNITTNEWEEFLEEQIPRFHLTAKAFSSLKGITKGFLKRAKKQNLIRYNVEDLFDELDVSDSDFRKIHKDDEQEVFMEDELPKIIEYLVDNQDEWNLGILLMFVTGLRVGELVALRHSDYANNPCGFYIRQTETRYKENGKYVYQVKDAPKTQAGFRFVIIPKNYEWVYEKIKKINSSSEYIMVGIHGQRMTTNSIRRRMERICLKLNMVKKSPHKVRKTYGTILLDNQIDKNMVIGQMGHTDIVTTERHYHRNRKSFLTKADILNQIPEFTMAETSP